MPHALLKRPFTAAYPLKKRPLKYHIEDTDSDSSKASPTPPQIENTEPENLSTKPEDLRKSAVVEKSPPPISLVAGRGEGGNPFAAHQPHPLDMFNYPVDLNSKGSVLGPLNLNSPAAYAKYPVAYDAYRPVVPPHFAPSTPPHVSPPIKQEPAYPVLRIEENQSHPFTSQYSPKREQHFPQFSPNFGQLPVKREPYAQVSPNYRSLSPKRDSVIMTPTAASTNPVTPTIVPTNVNGSVRYQCPDCNKSYSTYSGLSKHMQFHCASQNKKSFVCKFCEKVYVSLGALKMHIRTHTLPCKCTLCGKAFSRPWLLQGHIRTHTGEKPFTCQHCNRAFADRSNLRAHLQTHSEVKKYSCKSCSKTFSRMSLLTKHEESGCNQNSSGSNSSMMID